MPQLSLERIFSAPPLGGVLPSAAKLSPDGRLLTFLRPADDDRERLDLWCMPTAGGVPRCLVDSSSIAGNAQLSDVEKASRERRRVFSSGIVEYEWQADGQSLVFSVSGVVYRFIQHNAAIEALTVLGAQQSDVRLAPDATCAAYVRDGDLYAFNLHTRAETRLTFDGSATITNGIAEFIAQEEMHRFEGYWWSPDSQRIAYTRVDNSGVAETLRHEINAAGIDLHPQRYPFAGAANAQLELRVLALDAPGQPRRLPWAASDSEYLARVSWSAAGSELLVQRQNRLQDQLQLVRIDVASGRQSLLLNEQSTSWINLHDNLQVLKDGRLLWTSERSGTSQLYMLDDRVHAGQSVPVLHRLTHGNWMIAKVHGVSADHSEAYVSGWREDPTQLHLYAVSLAGADTAPTADAHAHAHVHARAEAPPAASVRQLTEQPGWHQITLSADAGVALDLWSSTEQLPHIDVIDLHTRASQGNVGVRSTTLIANALADGHPLFPYRAQLARAQFGQLRADDGQTLHYRLITPPDFDRTRPYPVLQHVYGGPGVARVRQEWLPFWYHFLCSRNLVVFELDNRGSSGRGPAFEAPIHRRLGAVEVVDQLLGLDWLTQQPFVDASRVALAGHSYGGFMTLMLLAKAPGRFAAGMATAPVADWALYDTHYTERYLGLPQDNPLGYAESAVLSWLARLRDPLLLVHGMADDNVLFTHTTRLLKALQDQGADFELMTYPGSKHGLAEQSVSLHRHRLMYAFLRRHLHLAAG